MSVWVGIDIGSESIKVAVLKTAYRKVALVGVTTVPLEAPPAPFMAPTEEPTLAAPAVVPGMSADAARLAALVRQAAQSLVPKGGFDGCATSLPGVQATLRSLTVPASAQKQIAGVLPFELEALVPFDMDEAVYDYRVLTTPREEGADIPVLAAVARTADVQARIDVVKAGLGVEPERVGVGPMPLANLVPHLGLEGEGPTALLDLGLRTSDLLIVERGEPVFARTLSAGTEGLPGSARRLAREVRTTLAAYRAAGGQAPARVLLCGGGAFQPGAESFLSSEVEAPVTLVQPPGTIDLTALAPSALAELPRYAKALGLAMGLQGRALGLDLRRGPLTYERGYRWLREKVPVLAGLGSALLVSFVFSAAAQLYAEGRDKVVLEEALGLVSKDVFGESTTAADRAQELLAQQAGSPDDDPMPRIDAFDVMVKISEAIPQSMKHDIEELDVQKGHVVIQGIVSSVSDAESIKASLQSEKCFADIKITRTTQVVGGERQKYVMELDMRCPEDVKKKKDDKTAPAASASAGGSK